MKQPQVARLELSEANNLVGSFSTDEAGILVAAR